MRRDQQVLSRPITGKRTICNAETSISNDWKAVAFCRTADLASLVPRTLPRPSGFRPDDTADISLSHYERNPLAISGKQRKGI